MPAADVPRTISDFVARRLAGLPEAARLAVVFDPYGDLLLDDAIEAGGHAWHVTRYDGNDLAFRQAYHPGQRDLVWVTCPPGYARQALPRIELRTLIDAWRRADAFIDASLPGVLQQLVPRESWPADSVWRHADVLGQNLPAAVEGVKTLRLYLERGASLDAHAIRALALHCLQPGVAIQDLLFRHDTAGGVLHAYIGLLWKVGWSAEGMALLQAQARGAPRLELAEIAPWLSAPPASLALYLYLRRTLARYRVPNIANQLRGLGLLAFDPEPLEPLVESVLARWEREPAWRRQVVVHAEAALQSGDPDRVAGLLGLRSAGDAFAALLRADTPAMLYALGARFFQLALEARRLKRFTPAWAQRRPPILSDLPQTPFARGALALARLFDELAAIDQQRGQPIPSQASLPQLIDWYVEGGFYDLEYAHARARHHVLDLPDDGLRQQVKAYLGFLEAKIRQYLDRLDHALADLIAGDWQGYLGSPRLSTRVLWDTVIQRRLSPTPDACLWIVVFDGMRWDTWVRHVRPRLLERFELAMPEKAYLCLLPSWTSIARTGLLAGKVPEGWQSYEGHFTRDQEQLVSRLFGLPQRDRGRSLRFYSGMESDLQYRQLDEGERLPFNVLVYNVSDDNLHHLRSDLLMLNETVDLALDHVFQVLGRLVRAEDMVVVSSDHGFVELIDGGEVVIADDDRWQRYVSGGAHPVNYRYALTHDLPDSPGRTLKVRYPRCSDLYTVAVGRTWFKRANWRGPTDRYAHGGLSLAEMVVPGVLLRPIVEPRVDLAIELEPRAWELAEGEVVTLTVRVVNRGNVPASGHLQVAADTAAEAASYAVALRPGERQDYPYQVEAVYRRRSDGTEVRTHSVDVSLRYRGLDGEEKASSDRVAVAVQPRKDVVEIDFGGLDDLDV